MRGGPKRDQGQEEGASPPKTIVESAGSVGTATQPELGKVVQKPFWLLPCKAWKPVRQEIEAMLQARFIKLSNIPWRSPLVLLPKLKGSIRMCLDFLEVNCISVRCHPHVPGAPNTGRTQPGQVLVHTRYDDGVLAGTPEASR